MQAVVEQPGEWIDGFLFVANRPILDFLNTRPVLTDGPTELLPDFHALERWLIAAGLISSTKMKSLLRSWRQTPESAALLGDLVAFRERLRNAVLRMEAGSAPSDEFIREVNAGLLQHPQTSVLRNKGGRIVREPLLALQHLEDLWTPLLHETANLITETHTGRLRQCEACVVHFFDTSKKGSRRWCSMNICGNKFKVATYQRRRRNQSPDKVP